MLVDAGVDVNAKSLNGETPLHAAARQGKGAIVEILLAAGAEVDVRDSEGNTPLSLAQDSLAWARKDKSVDNAPYEVLLRRLREGGAGDDGRSPLHQAIAADDLEAVNKLIADGADVNQTGPKDITAAHIASEIGNPKILSALIEAGAEVDRPNTEDLRPLHRAANAEIARMLIANEAKLVGQEHVASPLYMAAIEGRADVVRELVGHRGVVKNTHCAEVLSWATFAGQIEVIKVLFEVRGAKIMHPSRYMDAPLQIAASASLADMDCPETATPEKRRAIAELLIAHGADVNTGWGKHVDPKSSASHWRGGTPLMAAAFVGDAQMVALLLKHRADVKSANANGETALHFAVQQGQVEIVKMLIDARAPLDAKSSNGKTPLDQAKDPAVKALLRP